MNDLGSIMHFLEGCHFISVTNWNVQNWPFFKRMFQILKMTSRFSLFEVVSRTFQTLLGQKSVSFEQEKKIR